MDNAVALVQAYLQVNGYFTVTEYPVLEAYQTGISTATDLDVLAFRFPGAGRLVPGRSGGRTKWLAKVDPALECPQGQVDMVVGEVKEGRAEINQAARNRQVMRSVLVRFGCCAPGHVDSVIDHLLSQGWSEMANGHKIRVLAFGSQADPAVKKNFHTVELGHVLKFLEEYIREYWGVLRHAQFKHPAFSFLMTLEKARRGAGITHADEAEHNA